MKTQIEKSGSFPWKARKVGKRFQNLCTDFVPGWCDVLRWQLRLGPREAIPICTAGLGVLPASCPDLTTIRQPDPGVLAATWLGHSTFLLQLGGRNYLTDPILSSHCSPLPLRRFRRQGGTTASVDVLPRIDAVLLSHNHYDHMDHATLRNLGARVRILCPLGLRAVLKRWNFATVTELSWGSSAMDGNVRLTALPAQHCSGRTPFDRNQSLWCGWLLEMGERRMMFLGDTGYAPFYRELGDHFGPIDAAFIPIGAYRPAWFMKSLHLSPVEAVQVHRDLQARCSVAMHWGTFCLADEPLDEPPRLLSEALLAGGLPPEVFRIPRLNETMLFPS